MKYCQKNKTLVKSFQKQKLASVNKRWQVKLGNNYFMCLYSDLQSATKWVEALHFFHFTDFKRGKYSFTSSIPSMQYCATVWATCTYRTQQTPQLWMDRTGEGCRFFCSLKLPYLRTMSLSTILLLIVAGLVLVSYIYLNLNDSSPKSWMCITKTTYIPSLWCLVLQPHCTLQEQLCDEREGS